LRDDPGATIDDSCVACGNCGDVADAAVLCPSFYRADVIRNASAWDRVKMKLRRSIIGVLQRRRERKRVLFARVGA
jgi:indolepyruvate ferredoxin oxidoreductase alpha subunit